MKVQLIRYHDSGNINTRLARSLNQRQGVLPPLGLAYIASSIENAGHSVQIIDAIAEELSSYAVRQRIREFQPDIVGITAMTPTIKGSLEVAKIAKEEGAITVIGGVHMALFAYETLSFDYVDYGVIGEGEESIIELLNAIDSSATPEDIDGIAFKKDNRIIVGKARIVNDIDKLPMPAYHLLPMTKYKSIIGLHPVSTMIGSRGCPFTCHFCYKTPSDKKYRRRHSLSIVDEMAYLRKRYGIREIMFYDDLIPPKHAIDMCEEILSRNLRIAWESPQRVNLVNLDLLRLMKRAHCRTLRYGVEQGDPQMMKFIDKKISLEQVRKVFHWTKKAGIETFAYFIIGYAKENAETIRRTIDLAKELDPRFVMFTQAIPMPNTVLMDLAIEKGLICKDYWSDFTLGKKVAIIPPFFPGSDKWVERAYKEFYLRPSKILEQIYHIRSLSDLKKNMAGFLGLFFFQMHD